MAHKSNGFDPSPLLFSLSFIYLGCQGSLFLGDDVKCENESSAVADSYFLKDKNRLNLQALPRGKRERNKMSLVNRMCLFHSLPPKTPGKIIVTIV